MASKEGYVMHDQRCCSAMAGLSDAYGRSDTYGRQPIRQSPVRHDDSLSIETMHFETWMETDSIAQSPLCCGESLTLNAVQKGGVA